MRAVLVGGGTGGHIVPALAVAGYLKQREPDVEILYIGAKGAMEERLVPAAGYDMKTISISGFQRKLSPKNILKNIQTVSRLFDASKDSKAILKEFKPDICIGTGGYVSGPVIREAVKLGIATVIHESNAYPGVTTKMLAPDVDTVMLAMPDAKKYIKGSANIAITGNPVRIEVLEAQMEASRKKLDLDERPLILSFGGSLGAKAINSAMVEVLIDSSKEKKYQHIHGYGHHDKEFLDRLDAAGFKAEENPQIRLLEYIDDMPACLAAANLIICRSGAMTLSEIEAKGKASILIPSPNVAENHQYHNALALVKKNAANLIEEKNLTGEGLWKTVELLFSSPEKLKEIENNAAMLEISDANSRIYREIKRAIKKHDKNTEKT